MAIPIALRRLVEKRDGYRCAYCQTTEENCGLRMHIDHITPEARGGATTIDNLCSACYVCNINKCAQQFGLDPHTNKVARLFHPVQQIWSDHFAWDESGSLILGLTPEGRATVVALQMNNETIVRARWRWASAGWHPPTK